MAIDLMKSFGKAGERGATSLVFRSQSRVQDSKSQKGIRKSGNVGG